ncbi:MAG TPA: ArsA-related P-loop ATPase [Acidimicrobiales bacterium]|nr:ArsA-related P-loop ATPase [Acidimicrobiales bacterium]
MTDAANLSALVTGRSIIVCAGSGGVGKTTTAAALALEAAEQGRRACVVTIDPAKRLADALGLDSLTNSPGKIEGDWPGELYALMLDTKTTFDSLVTRYATTPEQAEAILANRLYRNISGALSGTQEYMAMEKLYELASDGDYDVIVVDTPPTRNALDFIDAPRRLTRFLDNRIFRLLMMPTRAYLKAVSFATQTFLRTISKVVGGEVVADAVAFFQAFEGMEQGFRDRAAEVLELLKHESTAFVLVTSPRRDAVDEARFFAQKLAESGIEVDGLVVNRLHPRFGDAPVPEGLGSLATNLADFRAIAEREEHHFEQLAAQIAPAPVVRVPFLADDVHDVEGLDIIGRYLFGSATADA